MAGQAFAFHEATILINGKEYPCRAAAQTVSRESENIHVNNVDPFQYSRGPKNYEGSLRILQETRAEILSDYPLANDLTDIVFDVAYGYARSTDQIEAYIWETCRVTEDTFEHAHDTAFAEIEMPMAIMKIRRVPA